MKTKLAITLIFSFFLLHSCKKNDNSPDPVPPAIINPDTLTGGWKKIIVDSSNVFADIFFSGNSLGYLVGNKVYKTVDGGTTWTIISNKTDFGNIAVTGNGNVFFSKPINDSVYKYVNGGATVTATAVPGAVFGMDVFFTDNNNGYFATISGLYNTVDAGSSWAKINTTGISFTPGYSSAYFSNVNTGWIVNPIGIYKSNGTALTWSKATITGTLPTSDFNSIFATANNTVFASTFTGELYKSTDGGTSFSQIKAFLNNSIHSFCDIHFTDNNTGYISVGNRIYKTTDAGASWTIVVALGEATLVELHFSDATHGWACGNKGTVLQFN